MKLNKIANAILGTTLVVSLLAGCTRNTNAPKTEISKNIGDPTYKYIKDNYFLVKDNKLIEQTGNEKESEVIDWYFDPDCPSCVKLDEIIRPKLGELSNQMIIRYHAMGFLSTRSIDEYSNRASAFILAVIEKDPEKGLEFFHSVMSENFKPKVGKGAKTPDSTFKELYAKIGGTQNWDEIAKLQTIFLKKVQEQTALAFNSEALIKRAKDRKLTVPFIIIGDSPQALNFLETLDAESFMLNSVKKYVESKKDDKGKTSEKDTKSTDEKDTKSTSEDKK